MSDKKFCFGLKKSKVDPTDHIVSFNYEKIEFPSKFSLKDRVKQVYDQLNLNSCSANATANFLSLSDKTNVLNCNISRLYLYFCTRWIDNNNILPLQDQGATLKSVFSALSQYHYVDEVKYPYLIEKVNDVPPKDIFEEGIAINKCPFVSFRQIIPSKYPLKYILYKLQQPVLFGMMVYDTFMKLTKENDILDLPTRHDELLGAHGVVICGFDETTDTFEILNSHGSDFANNGYFKIKSKYLLDPNLAFEFYVMN